MGKGSGEVGGAVDHVICHVTAVGPEWFCVCGVPFL